MGFVASGIFSLIAVKLLHLDFDGTNLPFYIGGVISLVACLTNLTLPSTPPPAKGGIGSFTDAFGLGTLKLMTERNFAAFVTLSFLSVIPFSMYWSYGSEFLQDKGFEFM